MENTFLTDTYDGHGMSTDTFSLLQKALSAGDGVNAAAFTGGRAMSVESLDQTLVNVLHTREDAVIFRKLKTKPISSPVHQWNYRDEVGDDDGAWVPEGGTSSEQDQNIARKYATAKYLQTLRKVTLQAAVTDMIEDAIAMEKNAGALWVIRNVEKGIISGDSANVAEEPDGLIKLIPSTNVIDLRGKNATSAEFETAMNSAARIIRENFGQASNLISSTMVMQDVQALLRDRIRFEAGKTEGSSIFSKYPTPFGSPELKEDVFITEGGAPRASSLTASRPSTPTLGTAGTTTGQSSQFATADLGTYYYKVEAINKYGASVASAEISQAVSVAAADIHFTITDGSTAGTAYKIYRSAKDAGSSADVRYMTTIPRTGAATVFTDLNADLPGTSSSFVLTMDPMYNAIEWLQFLPLMKFELYPTNAAVYPFLMLLFGTLALKKPTQHIRIKNIAPSDLTWF